jgi:hypothetical protein
MLEGRKACVPGYEDSSAGHTKTQGAWTKVRGGPDSCVFDCIEWGLHGEQLQGTYDEEALVDRYSKKILDELTAVDNRLLKYLVRTNLQQAKKHCDECHGDIREKFAKKETP